MRRFLTVLMAMFFAAAAANAQQAKTSLPDAPKATVFLANASPGAAIGGAYSAPSASQATQPSGTISLYTVVDLALRNSKAVLISEAARRRARAVWAETRDVYIPNFSLGSGLGYSYGFPLGSPTLFNATSTSLLFSFSQRDYIRSAKAAAKAATLSLKDTRQKVILDVSQTYIALGMDEQEISALQQASSDAANLVSIMGDRERAGLESDLTVTNSQLTQAQIQLREIRLEDQADELRQHLADLTGLDESLIVPSPSTVPPLPSLDFSSIANRSGSAPAVQAAEATAHSKLWNAWGDKRQNYRPNIGLAFQYARFAPFNNYSQYYQHFNQYNNVGIGIQATWPLFDPLRREKAVESKAEAERSMHEAELARIQNSESDLTLWHSLLELKAEARVAQLRQTIAQQTLESTLTQMNGSSSSTAPPVAPQQAEQGRIEERTRYADLQDADWNVIKVKLALLNAVGRLEDWVKQQPPFSGSMKK